MGHDLGKTGRCLRLSGFAGLDGPEPLPRDKSDVRVRVRLDRLGINEPSEHLVDPGECGEWAVEMTYAVSDGGPRIEFRRLPLSYRAELQVRERTKDGLVWRTVDDTGMVVINYE